MANPSLVYAGRKPSLGGKEWTLCLQQGQATLGYHSGREQCQYTLGWKPFVPPDVLTYFYSLSSSHRPSLPILIPIPQKYKYQHSLTSWLISTIITSTNTAKRLDLFLRLSHSSQHMCTCAVQDDKLREFFYLSINSRTSALTKWLMSSSIIWGHQLVKVEISTMFECLIYSEKTYFPSEG